LFFYACFWSYAQTSSQITRGLTWLTSQIQNDGSLLSEPQSIATRFQNRAEAAQTLKLLSSAPANLLNAINAEPEDNTEYLARKVISLGINGWNTTSYMTALSARQNTDGGFGGAAGYSSNTLDTARSVLALAQANQSSSAAANNARAYLTAQLSADGGMPGSSAIERQHSSAITLLALQTTPDATNATAIRGLTTWLLQQQGADGSWSSNIYLTAFVLTAVSPVTADATARTNASNFLLAQQASDGSWSEDPFLTALVLRALSPQSLGSATGGVLQGQVVDSASNMPLSGATVTIGSAAGSTVSTDSAGMFTATGLAAGSYSVTYARAGYNTSAASYAVNTGQTTNAGIVKLTQLASVGVIRGQVVAAGTSTVLAGVTVTLTGSATMNAVTDINGRYELDVTTPGAFTITASLSGYQNASISGTLASGTTLLFSPTLYPNGQTPPTTIHYTGTVVSAGQGTPLSGVSIQITGTSTAAATSNASGQFDVTLPAGSYTAAFSLTGYGTATQTFAAPAGTTVNAGNVALSPLRTSSTIQGKVLGTTSTAIAGATVQIVGTSLTTATAADGSYTLSNVPGTSFSVRASAAGYNSQTANLQVSSPTDLQQNFTLSPQGAGTLAIGTLNVTPTSVGSNTNVTVTTAISNTGSSVATAIVQLQVLDSSGKVVGSGLAYDASGNPIGQVMIAAGQQQSIKLVWNSAQFPTGSYTLDVRLVEAGSMTYATPQGNLLTESTASVAVTGQSHFTGSVTANPPVLQAGTNTPVALSALVKNDGNAAIPAQSYTLKVINTGTSSVVLTERASGTAMAINGLQTLSFASWTPTTGANYRLELTAADPSLGLVTGTLYVGDAAKATYTTNKLVVPSGTQIVRGTVNVTGQDVTTGTISDPLAPVIKSAVQKAMDYNYVNAALLTKERNCYACHVQAQAIVGGELTRRLINYDQYASQRHILMNMMVQDHHDDGLMGIVSGTPITQNTIGTWSLNTWHNTQEIMSTFVTALDFLAKKQNYDGSWTADQTNLGWWRSTAITTGLNVKTFVEARQKLSTGPAQVVANYASQPWVSSGIQNPHCIVTDSAGNVYVCNADGGNVLRIQPDGTSQPWITGLNTPVAMTFGPDGLAYVSTANNLYRRNADGTLTLLLSGDRGGLAFGPDGNLYMAGFLGSSVYRITMDGSVSTYIQGNGLSEPIGITFDTNGDMLVVNYGGGNVIRYHPDLTSEIAMDFSSMGGGARFMQPYKGGWVISLDGGIYLYDQYGYFHRIFSETTYGLAVTQDGTTILAGDRSAQAVYKLTPNYLSTSDLSTRMDASIQKGINWLLVDSNVDSNDNLSLAHRLMGLNAAKQYYQGQPLADSIQAKMQTVGALLRSRVNANGGWGWHPGDASDSLVTAQVGVALDTLNPSASDPIVQNAVVWLLSRQQVDGTWLSENGIMSTPIATTTWVSIWLPIVLDRLGGIDTDLTVTFPPNVAMSNPDTPPATSTNNSDGSTTVKWSMTGVTSAGRAVNYDLTLQNMQPGEVRAVSTDAHLTFKNSFTGSSVDAPIDIPRVSASSFLSLGVTTDKVSYGANGAMAIIGQATNTGDGLSSGSVKFDVYTPTNALVTSLGTVPFSGLAAGASTNLAMTWNTGTTQAGSGYYVLATLYDSGGRFVGTAKAVFSITDVGSSTALTAKITTDKQAYLPSDTVTIGDHLINGAANAVMNNLTVVINVMNPDGTQRFSANETLPQLAAGASKDYSYSVPLNMAPAGQYSVTVSVTASDGSVVTQSSTSFTVASTASTGAGLTGTVAASPKQVPLGNSVALSFTVNDAGNSAIANLPLMVAIINPATQAIVAQFPATTNLAVGTPYNAGVNWTATGAAGTNYIAVLSATVGGKPMTLAQDTFTVIAPPIKLDISQALANGNRVLVLVSCSDGEDDAVVSGKPPVCQTTRSQVIDQALSNLGVTHLITTNETDFKQAFRSGIYNTYWISGKQDKLHDTTASEIAEAVYGGDGLILDGVHDQRNKTLDAAGGYTWRGKIGETNLTANITGNVFVTQNIATVGRADKMDLNGSTQQGALIGTHQTDPYGAAILTNADGNGHAVTYTFDLPTSLQAQSAWQAELGASLQYALPAQPSTLTPGAVLPIKTNVVNQAQAVNVDVKSTLPSGAGYLGSSPTGTLNNTGDTIDWAFNLPASQTQTLLLTLRAPGTAGDGTMQTTVSTINGGVTTPYGNPITLPFTVAAAAKTSSDAIATLQALNLTQASDTKLRSTLVSQMQSAMTSFQQGTQAGYDAAISQWINVVGQLSSFSVDTSTIHLGIDRLIKEAQWRWSTATK
jgi:hypothetical protein